MKKLLFISMLLFSICSFAQNEDTHRVYCELLGTAKFMSTKVTVSVDFGQDEQGWNAKLVDENGKSMSFNSMVDAMNFMGKLGWKFEQAYTIGSGGNFVYHWLLSKDLSNGESIKDGIVTKSDVKK